MKTVIEITTTPIGNQINEAKAKGKAKPKAKTKANPKAKVIAHANAKEPEEETEPSSPKRSMQTLTGMASVKCLKNPRKNRYIQDRTYTEREVRVILWTQGVKFACLAILTGFLLGFGAKLFL